MNSWQEDLLTTFSDVHCEAEIFSKIKKAGQALGFDYVAYGIQMPLPVMKPKVILLNNYPESWQRHYDHEHYMEVDPTVKRARKSLQPFTWTDELFEDTPRLWDDAKAAGLGVGWVQSCFDPLGSSGMLTLARSGEPMTPTTLACQEIKYRWLANISHQILARVIGGKFVTHNKPQLSNREIEVLKWTADGKSSADISHILNISVDTVNFHIKNSISKLGTSNKTAAVVRASLLGAL